MSGGLTSGGGGDGAKAEASAFREDRGIFVPPEPICHRSDEYDEAGFDLLLRMQRHHFWYRGRHEVLLEAVLAELAGIEAGRDSVPRSRFSAVDMGGGCGGWLEYLHARTPRLFGELALVDSSRRALELAEPVVGSFASRYQADLRDLPWKERWDVVFLLDVLEHIPEHADVLRQVGRSLRPGGLLFVTAPALRFFWSYNDDLARHQRRYSRRDLENLGQTAGLPLKRSDYFMFLLSPALYASRRWSRPAQHKTDEAIRDHLANTHRIPKWPINTLLYFTFSLEAVLGRHVRLPWGTSILGVFQRPYGVSL